MSQAWASSTSEATQDSARREQLGGLPEDRLSSSLMIRRLCARHRIRLILLTHSIACLIGKSTGREGNAHCPDGHCCA
jgi:hypothetical protein